MNSTHITVITDCQDDNAKMRQKTRLAALFKDDHPVISFVGVDSDVEAAGNLIDALDAGLGTDGVILVNVAPRNGGAREYGNGTPFGWFWYRKTLVVVSLHSFTLGLVRKLDITRSVFRLDLEETAKLFGVSSFERERIVTTQFRSLEFVPRAALMIRNSQDGGPVATSLGIDAVTMALSPHSFWLIDNFGNIKTAALPRDIAFRDGAELEVLPGKTATCFAGGLRAVPDGQLGIVVGSSGLEHHRFIEIVANGESAAEELGISDLRGDCQGQLFRSLEIFQQKKAS